MSSPDVFPHGYGADPDWRTAAAACLDQLDEQLDGRTGVGFVYLSDHFAPSAQDILTVLRGRTGIDDWVGTAGIGIAAGRDQLFDEPAMSVMVAPMKASQYAIQKLDAMRPPGFESWFGVLHGNPEVEDLPAAIDQFAGETGGFWVGGLAASRAGHPMIARGIGADAVSGVMLSPDVEVQTALTQGCSPIGPMLEITRAEDNLVIEIEGRPAFEVFKEQIGELLSRNLDRIPGFIFAGLPVSGADSGDYMVRDIMGVDPQNGIVAIGAEAEVGGQLMFCRRDGASAEADMKRMLDGLQKRVGDRQPKGGLYYSCLGRGPAMFPESRTELDMIAERFGDIPLTGFFCNGEVSNARLYTYTGVLSLFM
jgi:small ligand-binding sensory domain FIST